MKYTAQKIVGNKLDAGLAPTSAEWNAFRQEDLNNIAKRRAKVEKKNTAISATFEVGQLVKDRKGNIGTVVDCSTSVLKVDFAGTVRGFQPKFIQAA